MLVGTIHEFVGWYDGKGGITTDPDEAFEVMVDNTKVQDISILIPFVSDKSIHGAVTGPDGQLLADIGLKAKLGGRSYWTNTEPDSSFHFSVSSGAFVLEVYVLVGTQFYFIGWYDGAGGITTDPDQAFEIVVVDEDVEDIDIALPANPQDLLCPSGQHRSTVTGQCG